MVIVGYYYDTGSIPVYDLREPKTNAEGNPLYSVFDIQTGKYLEGEFTYDEAQYYSYWPWRYQVSPIYRDIEGLTIVRPVGGASQSLIPNLAY